MTDRCILCMKYGTAYPADYVNVLFNACRKALRRPARFVCLTDDAAGLLPGIETFPIPDVGLTREEWFRGGVWPKIGLFDRDMHGLRGRAVFIDLDMVVLGGVDDFFDHGGDIVGIDAGANWGRTHPVGPPQLGSGLMAFDLGAHGDIADQFRADKSAILARHRQEQRFVHEMRPNLAFWPQPWVISFKRALRRPIGPDLLLPPHAPPPSAKVLAFHGTPRPADLMQPGRRFWDRFPHLGNGPVPWMVDYWRDNGGRLPI